MARKECRSPAATEQVLTCLRTQCGFCSQPIWVAYRTRRTITTGPRELSSHPERSPLSQSQCEWYHRPYRPEEEGRWALLHGEFGLDVITLVGTLRYTSHRSVPEIHQTLRDRGIQIAERTVTHLLQRYEELVALRLSDQRRLRERFKEQEQILLAIDGLQPDVGHEVLWVLRDCLSGEVLLARSLLSSCEADLANLLREVQQMLVVRGPVRVVASVASRLHSFSGTELCLTDPTRWRALRSELDHRHEARRMQHRFRKSPESYLANLEEKLIKERLPL